MLLDVREVHRGAPGRQERQVEFPVRRKHAVGLLQNGGGICQGLRNE